jgi:heme/copper-type cytochrome/quinol oxidase subunit 2
VEIRAVHLWSPAQGLIDARAEYDHLFSVCVPIAIAAFTLIVLVAFAAVVICRRRPLERAPVRRQERNPFQGSYAVFLVCVAALLLYLTFTTERQLDTVADQHHPSVVIKILASHVNPSRTSERLRGARVSR